MYQISDIYSPDLTRKPIGTSINIHALHQHRDQVTGVEQKKSLIKKKKKNMAARINLNLRNRQVAELARKYLKDNTPIKTAV